MSCSDHFFTPRTAMNCIHITSLNTLNFVVRHFYFRNAHNAARNKTFMAESFNTDLKQPYKQNVLLI